MAKKMIIKGLEADNAIVDDFVTALSKAELRAIEQKAMKAIFDKEHADIDPQYERKMSCDRSYKRSE